MSDIDISSAFLKLVPWLGGTVIALASGYLNQLRQKEKQREDDRRDNDARYASVEAHLQVVRDVTALQEGHKIILDRLPRMHQENSDKLTALAVAIGRIEGSLGTKPITRSGR